MWIVFTSMLVIGALLPLIKASGLLNLSLYKLAGYETYAVIGFVILGLFSLQADKKLGCYSV